MDFAWLILENGNVFKGRSFGAKGTVAGETVFTTGMTAYQETLTDPSYAGQIITQTFPLIGNYGVNDEDYESIDKTPAAKGYIVREYCEVPSNFRSAGTIDGFLKKHGVIGLCDIDTRALTRIIRETGVMNGIITDKEPDESVLPDLIAQAKAYKIGKVVPSVSVKQPQTIGEAGAKHRIALIDYGCKEGICEALMKRGCSVTILPWNATAEEITALKPDGIMLSNGPGDPEENTESIAAIKGLMKTGIPLFGICLGHQLTALANGAKTFKLKYGHRGANQPVIDLATGKTYVTSQNHGYAVDNASIDTAVAAVSHINANDKTCEGVRYNGVPVFTVQFHPEARGGPLDTGYLFDEFLSVVSRRLS
jgi:carbamoyl-phosphate synthase small subunit